MGCTAIQFLPLCSLCPALTLLLSPSLVGDPQGCGLAGCRAILVPASSHSPLCRGVVMPVAPPCPGRLLAPHCRAPPLQDWVYLYPLPGEGSVQQLVEEFHHLPISWECIGGECWLESRSRWECVDGGCHPQALAGEPG